MKTEIYYEGGDSVKDLVLIKGFGNRRYEPPSSLMPHEPVGMQGPSNRRVRVSEEDAGGAGCGRAFY